MEDSMKKHKTVNEGTFTLVTVGTARKIIVFKAYPVFIYL